MSTARIIKKYPNRRLYDTEDSRYITLADIRQLVLNQTKLVVIDKKSGDDITRSILLQVISEQELNGFAILSEEFLAQIICCHGEFTPGLVADHLAKCLTEFVAHPQNQPDEEGQRPIMIGAKIP
jgi:polyhydroxyalkanoate synthesis repressor PhaR